MVETSDHHMGPFFHNHPKVFLALSLLLIFSSYHSNPFSSAFLTLFILAFSASFPFFLAKLRQFCKPNTMERPPELEAGLQILPIHEILEENKATQEEAGKFPQDELVTKSTGPSLEYEDISGGETDGHALLNGSVCRDKDVLENPSPSECFKFSLCDDEPLPKNSHQLKEFSEGSISDDDNLIEIEIPHGNYVVTEESNSQLKPELRGGFLLDFLPETVCRQHGLMELLSEINEEDNLIEIDIARGSIKCSRVGIKA
ncbi:uncharacterized protein LOC103707640 [Phoenix dactylifera]|uniref:Uncharacterized protein LOC103707640 n=1 Tax=Phoenix dactylifera TaxID=42345 RepID=A0A8B8J4P3_PHODC|nr:uncharacterized protein LOC103707640 [Phoenix dactylifera]XP_038982930.1 uncharacterized protein LOC103707640 [Phoenix dactylifera]